MQSPPRFQLSKYVNYRMDFRLLLVSLCITAATLAVYLGFYDILSPFIPGGSVRANSGPFFILPVVLLLSGQTLFDTWVIYAAIFMATPDKSDALKAYFVASVQIFLFSIFYVLFPNYGPYTYIIYFMPNVNFGPSSYPVLLIWTLTIILVTYALTRRVFRLENDTRIGPVLELLLAAASLALIMVMAD